jgi:hypothetical protein
VPWARWPRSRALSLPPKGVLLPRWASGIWPRARWLRSRANGATAEGRGAPPQEVFLSGGRGAALVVACDSSAEGSTSSAVGTTHLGRSHDGHARGQRLLPPQDERFPLDAALHSAEGALPSAGGALHSAEGAPRSAGGALRSVGGALSSAGGGLPSVEDALPSCSYVLPMEGSTHSAVGMKHFGRRDDGYTGAQRLPPP